MLFYLLIKFLFFGGSFFWEVYRRVYIYDLNWIVLKNIIIIVGFIIIFGVVIVFLLVFLVGRIDMYGKKFFRILFVVIYMVLLYVGVMVWLRFLNLNVGVLNKFLMKIFGLGIVFFNIYIIFGIVWVLICFFYFYVFIIILRVMEKMDLFLEEVLRILGVFFLKILFKVIILMMILSIIVVGFLVFVVLVLFYGILFIIGVLG